MRRGEFVDSRDLTRDRALAYFFLFCAAFGERTVGIANKFTIFYDNVSLESESRRELARLLHFLPYFFISRIDGENISQFLAPLFASFKLATRFEKSFLHLTKSQNPEVRYIFAIGLVNWISSRDAFGFIASSISLVARPFPLSMFPRFFSLFFFSRGKTRKRSNDSSILRSQHASPSSSRSRCFYFSLMKLRCTFYRRTLQSILPLRPSRAKFPALGRL